MNFLQAFNFLLDARLRSVAESWAPRCDLKPTMGFHQQLDFAKCRGNDVLGRDEILLCLGTVKRDLEALVGRQVYKSGAWS